MDDLALKIADIVTHAQKVSETVDHPEIEDLPESLVDVIADDPLLDDYCHLGMAYHEQLSDQTMAAVRRMVAEAMIRQRRHDAGEAEVLKNLIRRMASSGVASD